MITRISINKVASFKNQATLQTDKKINIVYGLNGSGKSTIGRFLRTPSNKQYEQCRIEGAENSKIIVFNEDFIRENFFESPAIPGIFSLSKKNNDAEKVIAAASQEKADLAADFENLSNTYETSRKALEEERNHVVGKVFEIKRKYSGGDRVLDYCLDGVMTSKEKLYERLSFFDLPSAAPQFTVKDLQEEARMLSASDTNALESLLPLIKCDTSAAESNSELKISITGASTNEFSEFINQLKHSDWVREGEKYIRHNDSGNSTCPFCQEETIDTAFIEKLQAYFDKSYSEKIEAIRKIRASYSAEKDSVEDYSAYYGHKFYDERINQLSQRLISELEKNLLLLDRKIESPSEIIELTSTLELIAQLNEFISEINRKAIELNTKIANKKAELARIKSSFWTLMRWEYDQSVSYVASIDEKIKEATSAQQAEATSFQAKISEINENILIARRSTINIDESVDKINNELSNVGITDFSLKKHEDHLYRLSRSDDDNCEFRTLSEGEKTIIGFLYFCELSSGIESPDEAPLEKIVVLDDPVSSLSHIYIFNVGRMIIHRLFKSASVKQVFVLTHSLYFFYELTDINKDSRNAEQSLFRVTKNGAGSQIVQMKYEELQNDYHAYWQVVNDSTQPPALLANCMRNIVEYFFGFVEKQSFSNVFQKPELSTPKFQAFNRYMNRESHSFGQNVFDLKEFDFDTFKEGLKLVFTTCGYEKHYKKMAKLQ